MYPVRADEQPPGFDTSVQAFGGDTVRPLPDGGDLASASDVVRLEVERQKAQQVGATEDNEAVPPRPQNAVSSTAKRRRPLSVRYSRR